MAKVFVVWMLSIVVGHDTVEPRASQTDLTIIQLRER